MFVGCVRASTFTTTRSDAFLFVLQQAGGTAYLLLYVDDAVLKAYSDALLQHIISRLHASIALKDLGPLHFFLNIQVHQSVSGFFLHQA